MVRVYKNDTAYIACEVKIFKKWYILWYYKQYDQRVLHKTNYQRS